MTSMTSEQWQLFFNIFHSLLAGIWLFLAFKFIRYLNHFSQNVQKEGKAATIIKLVIYILCLYGFGSFIFMSAVFALLSGWKI